MKMTRLFLFGAALTALVHPGVGGAQGAAADAAEPPVTIEDVDQKIRILQRQLELEREAAATARATAATTTVGASGVQFRLPDGSFQARFRGYVHEDGRFFLDDDPTGTSTFLARRLRPIIEGTVFGKYDFRLMTDFGGGTAVVQDAYVDVNQLTWGRVRVGKFKPPVGLERLQSATAILFVERAFPTNLVPNRDVGVQIWADTLAGVLSYAAGIFNGAPDGSSIDVDANSGKDLAGRIFLQPFRRTGIGALAGLGFGVAGSTGKQDRATLTAAGLAGYRTNAQQTFFSYRSTGAAAGTTLANGRRTRLSPQGYWYWGPAGILGEYVSSTSEVKLDNREARLTNTAWQVAGSYLLTGEAASFAGVRPRRSFDPRAHSWGAIELTGRVGALDVDVDAFPVYVDPARSATDATSWTAGVNWHLNQNVKLVVDYEHTDFSGGAATGDRHAESGILTRLQLAF
jgi:phosphate-selective porin OprO and OprP